MKIEIKVPEVGESITEVVIAKWLKEEGSRVQADEPLCEIESDKASFEIPAEQGGTLKILAGEGETVPVGSTIAEILTGNGKMRTEQKEKISTEGKSKPPVPEAKKGGGKAATVGKPVEIKVPEVGESITEVTLAKWLKKSGEFVKEGELICEIESDKASFEIPADVSGVLAIRVNEGATVNVGASIATITPGEGEGVAAGKEESVATAPAAVEKEETEQAGAEEDHDHRITPVAKKILQEAGIDFSGVEGSGQGGKITKEDALNAVSKVKAQKEAVETVAPEKEEVKEEPEIKAGKVETESGRPVRRQPMTTLRKTLSKRLVAAKNETAMLTTFNEVDMAAIMEIRKRYKESFKEKYNVNLGFMSFFVRAVCIALKEFPEINAMIDGEDVVYHDFVDVSIAVSSPRGLVVPVIRNAHTLQLHQIEAQVELLATKARENKLSIEEMSGGTFTISNGGVFGSLLSTPILNAPQSAILGMHKIQERPVVVEGQVVIRPMMYVALSYDHRMVDGRESVTFLVRVKEMLEDPARLLLEI